MIGQRFSHYTITEKLGEGGMGVVYKARDEKLERDVALKFLPAHLSSSEADKARFMQEAKAAAGLDHPNICTIFGVEEHDDQLFLVMAYVDGATLRERIGNLPLKQAIDMGIQLADGLAAAHEKGVVHRDIKPENIMIRKDGIVQIMDFGLARLRGKVTRLTKQGSTVGTAGYMSPEQIIGQDADHRSDIFSLGVVLYEMFTGQLPFRGVHETALAYEIVNVDPAPMAALKPELDPNLDLIVLDCLEKDPKERCQSVAEAGRDLRRVKRESTRQRHSRITAARPGGLAGLAMPPGSGMQAAGSGFPAGAEGASGPGTAAAPGVGTAAAPGARPASARAAKLPWIAAAVGFAIAAGAIGYHVLMLPEPPERPVMRSMIMPPARQAFDLSFGGHIAISPDGKSIAFVATDSLGTPYLWHRPLSSLDATRLSGTEGATYPFWSPESRKIGFFSQGMVKTIDAEGGPIVTVCEAPAGRGGAWNREGVIVFARTQFDPLFAVPAAGGAPVQITQFDTTNGDRSHRWPVFLPDGNRFLYSTLSGALGTAGGNETVCVASLDSSVRRMLFRNGSNVGVTQDHLLYVRQNTLVAHRFDQEKLELIGDPIAIADRMIYHITYVKGPFSVSANGVLILQTGENVSERPAIFDRRGVRTYSVGEISTAGRNMEQSSPRISFDGRLIALTATDPESRNADIWIHDISRRASSRLTFTPSIDVAPVWSPRGDSIIFQSNRNGAFNLFIKSANGSGDEVRLLEPGRNRNASNWSKDGRYFIFTSQGDPVTKSDVWIIPMSGDRKPVPLVQREFNESNGVISPDGRWGAYLSDETGRNEVYARLLDGSGGKFQISADGARRPIWKADPGRIYFSSLDRKFKVAYVDAGASTLRVDSIGTLFDFEVSGISGNLVHDMSADGRSFVAMVGESRQGIVPITLMVNWDKDLGGK